MRLFKKRPDVIEQTVALLNNVAPQFPTSLSTHGTGFQIAVPMARHSVIFVQRDDPRLPGAMYTYVRILDGQTQHAFRAMVPATAPTPALLESCVQEIAQLLNDFADLHAADVQDDASDASRSVSALRDLADSGLLTPRRHR